MGIYQRKSFLRDFFDKKFFLENAIAVSAICLVLFFPGSNSVGNFLLLLCASYIVLPVLFVRLVFKRRFNVYGFQFPKSKYPLRMVISAFVLLILALLGVWGILGTSFGKSYIDGENAILLRSEFRIFLSVIALSIPTILANEVLFRGFVLWSWRRKVGAWSIAVSTLLPVVLAASRIPDWGNGEAAVIELGILAFGSLGASIIAFASESFLASFCFFLLFDTLSTVFTMVHS